jgi:hypothetical protein
MTHVIRLMDGFSFQTNTGRFGRRSNQVSDVIALLIGNRLANGGDGALTAREISKRLGGADFNVPKVLHRSQGWDCTQRLYDATGRNPTYYHCPLDVEQVDVLDVRARGERILGAARHGPVEQAELRELIQLHKRDPHGALGYQQAADEVFGDFMGLLKRLYERYIEQASTDVEYQRFQNLYQQRFGEEFTGDSTRRIVRRLPLSDADEVIQHLKGLAAVFDGLRELGVEDAYADLAGSPIDPEILLESVEHSLDFIGHTASKLRDASSFDDFFARLSAQASGVRVRFLLSRKDSPLEELATLRRNHRKIFDVRYYDQPPLFRITHIDGNRVAVQSYPQNHVRQGSNWDRGCIIYTESNDESFYHSFVSYFESEWQRNEP